MIGLTFALEMVNDGVKLGLGYAVKVLGKRFWEWGVGVRRKVMSLTKLQSTVKESGSQWNECVRFG